MEVELRLKEVLRAHHLDRHGVIQRLADSLHLHRHQVRKIYHNQATHPSLALIGKICNFLRDNGVPAESLPQCLFGARPEALWQAIRAAKSVWIYMGEYQLMEFGRSRPDRWVSRRDAEVAADIFKKLSGKDHGNEPRPTVDTKYVPFQIASDSPEETRSFLERDAAEARAIYERMKKRGPKEVAIAIGSQRVNYLVEHVVADLFKCQPFQPGWPSCVPFYLMYREFDRAVPSCFGGENSPPDYVGNVMPGIYYLDENRRWALARWEGDAHDAGVVITVRDRGDERLGITMFGVSGRATVAIGKRLTEKMESADDFWSDEIVCNGHQVGIYICEISYAPVEIGDDASDDGYWRYDEQEGEATVKVTPLSRHVLEDALDVPRRKGSIASRKSIAPAMPKPK